MEDKQLDVFEDRINRAISFIETLKAKEKTLVDEKEDSERKVEDLQEQIALKDQKKIETVLNKLESLANFDTDSSDDEKPSVDNTSLYGYERPENLEDGTKKTLTEKNTESSGEIFVEENIVDLKDENGTEQEPDQKDTTMSTPRVDQSPLFDTAENEQAAGEDEASEEHDLMKKKEQEHKPFSDNPFVEM